MTENMYTRLESLGYTEYEIEAAEDALAELGAIVDIDNLKRMLEILRTVR